MSDKDITERLRRCGCCDSHEGADEIERLRWEAERLRAERDEAKARIVRLLSQIQEMEAREQ